MTAFFNHAMEFFTMDEPFEFLEHTGDIRIGVTARSLEQLFIKSAEAMMTIIFGTEVRKATALDRQEINLHVDGYDLESLMVNWLSEQLVLTQIHHAISTDFELNPIKDFSLDCKQQICRAVATEDIKAVTYHDLVVTDKNGLFRAEITFDI